MAARNPLSFSAFEGSSGWVSIYPKKSSSLFAGDRKTDSPDEFVVQLGIVHVFVWAACVSCLGFWKRVPFGVESFGARNPRETACCPNRGENWQVGTWDHCFLRRRLWPAARLKDLPLGEVEKKQTSKKTGKAREGIGASWRGCQTENWASFGLGSACVEWAFGMVFFGLAVKTAVDM